MTIKSSKCGCWECNTIRRSTGIDTYRGLVPYMYCQSLDRLATAMREGIRLSVHGTPLQQAQRDYEVYLRPR